MRETSHGIRYGHKFIESLVTIKLGNMRNLDE